jgi:hypothetical protein
MLTSRLPWKKAATICLLIFRLSVRQFVIGCHDVIHAIPG